MKLWNINRWLRFTGFRVYVTEAPSSAATEEQEEGGAEATTEGQEEKPMKRMIVLVEDNGEGEFIILDARGVEGSEPFMDEGDKILDSDAMLARLAPAPVRPERSDHWSKEDHEKWDEYRRGRDEGIDQLRQAQRAADELTMDDIRKRDYVTAYMQGGRDVRFRLVDQPWPPLVREAQRVANDAHNAMNAETSPRDRDLVLTLSMLFEQGMKHKNVQPARVREITKRLAAIFQAAGTVDFDLGPVCAAHDLRNCWDCDAEDELNSIVVRWHPDKLAWVYAKSGAPADLHQDVLTVLDTLSKDVEGKAGVKTFKITWAGKGIKRRAKVELI